MFGLGNIYLKDMEVLLFLMNMVIYFIDKVKKFRFNREVRFVIFIISWYFLLFFFFWGWWLVVKDFSDCIFVIVFLFVDLKVLNENSFMKEY